MTTLSIFIEARRLLVMMRWRDHYPGLCLLLWHGAGRPNHCPVELQAARDLLKQYKPRDLPLAWWWPKDRDGYGERLAVIDACIREASTLGL